MSRNGVPIGNFRPNIASPSVTAVWPAGTVPKLRPHCLPPSFSRVAVSLFSMPSVPMLCPCWIHVSRLVSLCPFLFCSMSQITVLYVPIYIIVLYFHQVLHLTVTYYQVILPLCLCMCLAVGGHQLERCRRRLLPNNLVYVYMCT